MRDDVNTTRREAVRAISGAIGLMAIGRSMTGDETKASAANGPTKDASGGPLFTISLAQWSLHRALQQGRLAHLDFPKTARDDYTIDGVEYVNQFWKDKKAPLEEAKELKNRCADLGVTSVLIMCDGEGALGAADQAKRIEAAENHFKWLEAAKVLGCHSIRVNLQGEGTPEEHAERAADGLRLLVERAAGMELNVIVENHGGNSSNGAWLSGVMKKVGHARCGTLPDFGNFYEYDRYQGVTDMMPFAKGVSAKSHDFDETGNETKIDYRRMLTIVLAAGYHGRLGIEYEGERLSEPEGIKATKRLLERVREEMSKGR